MTAPARSSREDIESETVTFHKADGTPTTDKDEADTAEVTTKYKDGTTGHTIMVRKAS
jgi:hypothetical protein